MNRRIFGNLDSADEPKAEAGTLASGAAEEEDAETQIETEKVEMANNLIWTGKRVFFNKETHETKAVPRDVPKFVIDGGEIIHLPENLSKGAYVEEAIAEKLKTLFPDDFKHLTAR